MRRVVVVDDHELMAASLTAPLTGVDGIEVRSIGFDEASDWDAEWHDVDVALLDAADPEQGADRYPGVRLARRIRARAGDTVTIAIVTSRYTDDALRARLVALGRDGADYLFDRDELRTAEALRDFVRDPASSRATVPEPDAEWLERHGISTRADLEGLIDATVDDELLGPDSFQARSAGSRRATDRQLGELNALGLGRPGRRDRNPTVEQVRRVVARLLGRDR